MVTGLVEFNGVNVVVPVAVYQSGRLWAVCAPALAFAEVATGVPPFTSAWIAAIAALVTLLAPEEADETEGMTVPAFEPFVPSAEIGAKSFEIVAAFMLMELKPEMFISASVKHGNDHQSAIVTRYWLNLKASRKIFSFVCSPGADTYSQATALPKGERVGGREQFSS
jgi:hypothetical protein